MARYPNPSPQAMPSSLPTQRPLRPFRPLSTMYPETVPNVAAGNPDPSLRGISTAADDLVKRKAVAAVTPAPIPQTAANTPRPASASAPGVPSARGSAPRITALTIGNLPMPGSTPQPMPHPGAVSSAPETNKAGLTKPQYMALNKVNNPDDPRHQYDYTSAWRAGVNRSPAGPNGQLGHFPDTYKLPGHESFSNQSENYREGMPAVRWGGPDGETPIPIGPRLTKPGPRTAPKAVPTSAPMTGPTPRATAAPAPGQRPVAPVASARPTPASTAAPSAPPAAPAPTAPTSGGSFWSQLNRARYGLQAAAPAGAGPKAPAPPVAAPAQPYTNRRGTAMEQQAIRPQTALASSALIGPQPLPAATMRPGLPQNRPGEVTVAQQSVRPQTALASSTFIGPKPLPPLRSGLPQNKPGEITVAQQSVLPQTHLATAGVGSKPAPVPVAQAPVAPPAQQQARVTTRPTTPGRPSPTQQLMANPVTNQTAPQSAPTASAPTAPTGNFREIDPNTPASSFTFRAERAPAQPVPTEAQAPWNGYLAGAPIPTTPEEAAMMKDYEPRYQADPALSKTGGAITPDQVQSATEVAKEQAAAAGQPDQWQNIFANLFKPSQMLGGMRPASLIFSGLETMAKPASQIDVGGQLTRNEAAFNSPAEQARKELETQGQYAHNILAGTAAGAAAAKSTEELAQLQAAGPYNLLDKQYKAANEALLGQLRNGQINKLTYDTQKAATDARFAPLLNQALVGQRNAGTQSSLANADLSRAHLKTEELTRPLKVEQLKVGNQRVLDDIKAGRDPLSSFNTEDLTDTAAVQRLSGIDRAPGMTGSAQGILTDPVFLQTILQPLATEQSTERESDTAPSPAELFSMGTKAFSAAGMNPDKVPAGSKAAYWYFVNSISKPMLQYMQQNSPKFRGARPVPASSKAGAAAIMSRFAPKKP
jgi:hypothetical protein